MPKVVIVAGGLATRMLPITEEIPKCLIDINGKPLIQHQLEFFKKSGYTDIIFCVAHLADKVKDFFGDGKSLGMNIQYVQETKELMGTAGSVKLAEDLIGKDDSFLVYYGDNLTSMDFDRFLKFHAQKNALAALCVRPLPHAYKSSSIILLDEEQKIKTFLEKPPVEEFERFKNLANYINSGIYAFKRQVLDLIPADEKYDFAKQLFPRLIAENLGVYGYPTKEFFREIGTVEKYEKFKQEFKDSEVLF